MVYKILLCIVLGLLLFRGFAISFNLIGSINELLDHKKNKKIDISKCKLRKIFPYHNLQITMPWEKKVQAYFDGTIFKKTYVLTIVDFTVFLIIGVLYVLEVIYFLLDHQKIYIVLFFTIVVLIVVEGCVIDVIRVVEERRYVKRTKKDGMNFKI